MEDTPVRLGIMVKSIAENRKWQRWADDLLDNCIPALEKLLTQQLTLKQQAEVEEIIRTTKNLIPKGYRINEQENL
jgi:hypothetical protein